jgi:hypothetical protein
MSEHTQIDIRKGNSVVRIHSGWGNPRNILPALRESEAPGVTTPQTVAKKFMESVEDASFGLDIITEDIERDCLNFYYTVDISKTPWKVVQETCAGYQIGVGLVPARKQTIFIGKK